jgi:hypothetical protein
LRPRQRFARARAKRSVRECENEDSHSQVSSHFESSSPSGLPNLQRAIVKGQNTSHWGVLYIIWKLLKCRCLKWACMTHLDIWNTSYDKKKSRKSKLAIWFMTIKSRESTDFYACRWRATRLWKALDESCNFAWNLIPIKGLSTKL